jgi:hypothetical protein
MVHKSIEIGENETKETELSTQNFFFIGKAIKLIPGTKNEICVSLVYSGNVNEILFRFPLYTRETQILFFVPGWFLIELHSFLPANKIANQ